MLMVMDHLEVAPVFECKLWRPFLDLRLEDMGQGEDLWWMDPGDLVKGLKKGLEKGLEKELEELGMELRMEPWRGSRGVRG
jgi:hypothetical protein